MVIRTLRQGGGVRSPPWAVQRRVLANADELDGGSVGQGRFPRIACGGVNNLSAPLRDQAELLVHYRLARLVNGGVRRIHLPSGFIHLGLDRVAELSGALVHNRGRRSFRRES